MTLISASTLVFGCISVDWALPFEKEVPQLDRIFKWGIPILLWVRSLHERRSHMARGVGNVTSRAFLANHDVTTKPVCSA
jgi:hypothetical protein